MEPAANVNTTLTLPKGYFKSLTIAPKDLEKGITPKFLKEIWKSINCNLVEGEYKNLWALLHKNSNLHALCQNKEKGLKYVFPALLEVASKSEFSYLCVCSNANSVIPEMARKAGLTPRYTTAINKEVTFSCNVKRLTPGEDNFPKFRGGKESVSAIVIFKSIEGEDFALFGKNKPNQAIGSRPVGVVTGYRNPDESADGAVKRELKEETQLEIPDNIISHLVGNTYKRDYYPGSDDRNEVRVIYIDLAVHKKEFELKKIDSKELGKRYWTLIQHKPVEVNGRSEVVSNEIKASDDLAEVYILPIAEALNKMIPGTSGRAKVQAAYEAVQNKSFLQEQIVDFGWSSKLQSYKDVVLTTAPARL